jgi:glycosyltransferase involved in cell wall biosynthesis
VEKTYSGLRVTHISNGIDPERLPAREERYEGLSIAYAGTLYLGRDLSPVVRAMRAFIDRRPEAAATLKLRVAGNMDAALATRFRDEISAAGLGEAVEILGPVSSAEAMQMINRSHLGLVLAQGQPTQIPAKIYESIGMGVQTLVIAESTSAAAREARRVGAVTLEPADTDGIVRLLETIWSARDSRVTPLAPIAYDAIAARMAELFER